MTDIWRRRVLWRGYVHPHIQLKKSRIPHPRIHTQSMRGFSIKTETGSDNIYEDVFISHLYVTFH